MNDLSHLTTGTDEQSAPTEDSLKRISRLAEELDSKNADIKEAKAELKELKSDAKLLSQIKLPESLQEVGMESFKMANGKTVGSKEFVSASVKDPDKFYAFLEERGDDSLMKLNLVMGKLPKSMLNAVLKLIHEKTGILAEAKMGIHPQTLNKYIKELCGVGGETEAEMPLASLDPEMVSTFTYYKTTVKAKK